MAALKTGDAKGDVHVRIISQMRTLSNEDVIKKDNAKIHNVYAAMKS